MIKGYEYQSDFAKKYVAQGRAEEAARALLIVLRARGFEVPDDARERILSQKDPERLQCWLEKAAVADTVDAVFDEPS
jgi:thioredoxin-like negative regulator of GroEL